MPVRALTLAALAVVASGCSADEFVASGGDSEDGRRIPARVERVVDGDTLEARRLRSGRLEDVRLIGLDTPETKRPGTPIECGGPEASASLARLAPVGARVTLVLDRSQDARDRYGRLLAYVDRRGGRDLGEAQLRAGWGEVYVYDDQAFERLGRYGDAAGEARGRGRGVWGACGSDFHSADD